MSNSFTFLSKYNKRNTSIEILRILFMLLILIGHVYAHGSNLDYQLIYSYAGHLDTFWHTSMFSLCKIGVTGFMFISGFYGIKFNLKKLLILFFTSLFYYILLSKGSGFRNIFQPYSCWWYLNSYIFVYALSPFIEYGFKVMSKEKLMVVVALLIFYNYFGKYIAGENSHDTELLISIYIIARYLFIYYNQIKDFVFRFIKVKLSNCIITLFCLLAILPLIEYNIGLPLGVYNMTMSNNSPLILFFVGCLVVYANSHATHVNFINWLATSTLAVYLITDFPTIRNIINPFLFGNMFNGISYILIIGIFLGCICVDKIRELVFSLIFRLFARKSLK